MVSCEMRLIYFYGLWCIENGESDISICSNAFCDEKDIYFKVIKAYRKKALKYHPDKNSDPAAVEIFHKLSKALEILTDTAAKAAYDKILKARAAAQIRHKQLDAKRQKLKEDLEAREKVGLSAEQIRVQQAKNLQTEIERLRKAGSSLLEREQALLKEELARQAQQQREERQSSTESGEPIRIKLKWKCSKSDATNGGYNQDVIRNLFQKYADVGTVLLSSKKNGTAVLEFEISSPKLLTVDAETGLPSCPLSVTWISGKPSSTTSSSGPPTLHPPSSYRLPTGANSEVSHGAEPQSHNLSSDLDFENLVLRKMRQAEERKNLIEQMKKDDEEEAKSGT